MRNQFVLAFLVLVAIVIGGSYAFGVRPRTRRQWALVAVTLAFLVWILPTMVPVR